MAENKQPSPNFIKGWSDNRYPELDGDELHNATIIKSASPTSRSPSAIIQRCGTIESLSTSTIKAAFHSITLNRQIVYVNSEVRLYNLSVDTSYIVLPIALSSDNLYFTDTFNGCVISDGNVGWHINPAFNPTIITGINFYPTNSIAFLDGYTIINQTGTRFFNYSELNSTDFNNGLFVAGTSADVDVLKSLCVINRELYLFGEKHTEVWANTAYDVNTVFTRQDGRMIHQGIRSDNTVVVNGIGYNCAQGDTQIGVFAWQSGGTTRISCGAIEQELFEGSSIKMMSTFEDNRQYILVVINKTKIWAYDVETGEWSTRSYPSAYGGLVGAFKLGNYYYLAFENSIQKLDGTTDNNETINSYKITSHIVNLNNRLFHKLLQIDVGGDMATFEMFYKDMNGAWTNMIVNNLSVLGSYNRYRFQRLGSSRDRQYKIVWSSQYSAGVYAAYLDLESAGR